MTLFNMAFIISRDSSETYNQIKGKQMKAYFKDNQLYKIKVIGNAETIYYVREENLELIGINKSLASSMSILLENKKVKEINYLTKPEAVLYPAAELSKEDQYLRDFIWITGQRPANKNEIFIWKEAGSEN
jgi:hypothetical protein